MDFDGAYKYLMNQLEQELPDHLTYHNATHTKSVISVVETIGMAEGVSPDDLILLKTAALFHDAAFMKSHKNHEKESCLIAREVLPRFNYTEEEIETICGIIMATRVPQKPVTKLQEIICDADLHYLGTNHYMSTSDHLYNEFKNNGLVKNKHEWKQKQVAFLNAHQYFTPTARNLYGPKKEKHLNLITQNDTKKAHITSVVSDILLISFGTLIAGFALKGFLVPNNFFDGGVTGVSLLFHEFYKFNLAYIIAAFNLPLIVVGYFTVGKNFALKTLAAVILLSIFLLIIPYPIIRSDRLLISIFGGVFIGMGIGLTMRAGCALDGMEVLALYTLKRTSFSITEIILAFNIIIFSVAALKFGIETSLYSILTYFVASRMIDYVIEGIQAYTGVTIISAESEIIKHKLVNELGRGITVYKGERGFLPGKFHESSDSDIIFTVITRLELRKLKNLVYETDPKAFVFATAIREASGGILKRRQSH